MDQNGDIFISKCTCEVKIGGRCSHVACLLYLAEHVSINIEPRMSIPSTSCAQAWGKGSKVIRDPGPIQSKDYGKKFKMDRYMTDPRPENLRFTTKFDMDKHLAFAHAAPVTSNWISVPQKFEDYELDSERITVLKELRKQFLFNVTVQMWNYESDPLCTKSGVHVQGTLNQSDSDKWHSIRRIRITASMIKDFSRNSEVLIKRLWNKKDNVSDCTTVIYGKKNEKNAIKKFEEQYGPITKCGIFLSRKYPFIGASPDGIYGNALIEIKCPYVLKDCKPDDLSNLSKSQLQNFCCIKTADGKLQLKRTHNYYYQVQTQMFVSGYSSTLFII